MCAFYIYTDVVSMSRISYFPVDYSVTTALLYKTSASRNPLIVLPTKITCVALAAIAVFVETMQNTLFALSNTPIFILNKTCDLLLGPKRKHLPAPPKLPLINPALITLLGEEQCRKLAELIQNPHLSLAEVKARLPQGFSTKPEISIPVPPPLSSNIPPPPPPMNLFSAPPTDPNKGKPASLPVRTTPVDTNPARNNLFNAIRALGNNPPPLTKVDPTPKPAPTGTLLDALKAAFEGNKGRRASITGTD